MPAELVTHGLTLEQLFPDEENMPAIALSGISDDSRRLAEGNLFIACQGATAHGLDYIDQAIAARVAAVAWDATTASAVDAPVPMFPVAHLAERLGDIANRWFDSPTRSLKVAGVTGTNGKTTVAYLISRCLRILNRDCAYIGTLGSGIDEIVDGGYMTTPPCIELHRACAGFRDAGADFVALEVSSHGLEQRRVDGMHFDVAIFTNLSRDHIDYHGGMRAYGETKARLILDSDARNRIVNIDCEFGEELANRCGANVVTISTSLTRTPNGRPYVFATGITYTAHGSHIAFSSSWGDGEIKLSLPGDFNVANALDVLATLLCWDVPMEDACHALSQATAPPGRMQRVAIATDDALPQVYVDYCHTPASLEAALRTLRGHCSGQLWCVFGCGGDRDRGKRSMMGQAAQRHADVPVVTSDNPRSESPAAIITDVLAGMDAETTAIEDRATAIDVAVTSAKPGDTVLVAGKGHEHYQIIGADRIRFSDYDTALDSLKRRAGSGVSTS